jgi:hypothetical protein
MEEMMACSYTWTVNLHALLLKSGCSEVIQHSKLIFGKLLSPQDQDPLVTDIHAISLAEDPENNNFEDNNITRPVPTEIQNAFDRANLNVPSHAIFQTSLTVDGLKYTIASKHPGNSCVMFLSGG